jgi:hypothetical protein
VPRRFCAWVVTGPLGHAWAGVADLAELALRQAFSRRARG